MRREKKIMIFMSSIVGIVGNHKAFNHVDALIFTQKVFTQTNLGNLLGSLIIPIEHICFLSFC